MFTAPFWGILYLIPAAKPPAWHLEHISPGGQAGQMKQRVVEYPNQ